MEEEKWHPMEKQPGWEEDETKAEEIARQQNVNASLAAHFRTQARELAGGDPDQSENPMVKQWLEMAATQDKLANETRDQAEANYDVRQAKILAMLSDLMTQVAEGAVKMQRGKREEPINYDFTPTDEQVEGAKSLGVSDEDFRNEYRDLVFRSFGLNEEIADQLKSEFEKAGSNYPYYTRTVMPNVYLRAGMGGFGVKGVVERITVLKRTPERLV